MPETTDPTDETASGTTQSEFDPILTQEDFDKRTKARIARATAKYADYSDLQAKAQRLAQLEAANLSEAEKQTERIRALEAELQTERHSNLRRDVATAKGVPANRISGSTREELEESADELLAFIAERATPATKTPKPVGTSGATNTDSRLDPKQRAAAAIRQWAGSG
jgi:hypothetical protein